MDTKSTDARWLRLEAYPLISEKRMGDGSISQIRAVLGLGASDGRFGHQLMDPEPDPNSSSYAPLSLWVEREETHVDFVLGADFFGRPASATLFAQGYAVLDDSSCVDCENVTRYSQSWGASIVLRGALLIGPKSWWHVEQP